MYKSMVILILFTPSILSMALIDSDQRKAQKQKKTEKFIRWTLTDEYYIGRHPCASDSVCDCWYGPATMRLNIDCSNRNLTEPPKMFDRLHIYTLDLSRNALQRAPNMTEEGYSTVHYLNLRDNHIQNITENIITPELRGLNLCGNNISRIEEAVLIKLFRSNIQNLGFNFNPWACDCQSTAFLEFVKLQWWYEPGIWFASCRSTDRMIMTMNHEDFCPGGTTTPSPVIEIGGERYRKSKLSLKEERWVEKWI